MLKWWAKSSKEWGFNDGRGFIDRSICQGPLQKIFYHANLHDKPDRLYINFNYAYAANFEEKEWAAMRVSIEWVERVRETSRESIERERDDKNLNRNQSEIINAKGFTVFLFPNWGP